VVVKGGGGRGEAGRGEGKGGGEDGVRVTGGIGSGERDGMEWDE